MSQAPRPCEKVFLSHELADMLDRYDRSHKYWKWINKMGDDILYNREVGQKISKRKFPKSYVDRYGINNLYRYQHPEYYRSCYTLVMEKGIGICARILDLLTHKEYNDLFGYE